LDQNLKDIIEVATGIANVFVAIVVGWLAFHQFFKRKKSKYEDILSEAILQYLMNIDKKLHDAWFDLYYLNTWVKGTFNSGEGIDELKQDTEKWRKYERYYETCSEILYMWSEQGHYYWHRFSTNDLSEMNSISKEMSRYIPFTPKILSKLNDDGLRAHMDVLLRARTFISNTIKARFISP
jgi:hypothetical protein